MERVEGARTPYEVYCHHCRVTFPPEARRCIHCGGRLTPPGAAQREVTYGVATPGRRPAETAADTAFEEEEEPGSLMLRRFGGLAVWAALALAAVLSNLCQGRG